MRPSDTDLAWLAGIVDGEGTIGIHRANAKTNEHPYLRPHFQIVNTDLRILEKSRAIMTAITGRTHNLVRTNKDGNGKGHKAGYRVAANTQTGVMLLLPLLIPYLVGKRQQAELVLEFSTRRALRLSNKWYEFKEEDERIYSTLLRLNQRGDAANRTAQVTNILRSA